MMLNECFFLHRSDLWWRATRLSVNPQQPFSETHLRRVTLINTHDSDRKQSYIEWIHLNQMLDSGKVSDVFSQVNLYDIRPSPAICTSCSVRLWSIGRFILGKHLLLWQTTVLQTYKSISSLFVLFQKPVHQMELRRHELSEGEIDQSLT